MSAAAASDTQSMNDDGDAPAACKNFVIASYNVKRDRTGDDLKSDYAKRKPTLGELQQRCTEDPYVREMIHFDSRVERIARNIVESEASIVVLNEMRRLETSQGASLYAQPGMDRFRVAEMPIDDTKESFINCVLWDHTKWQMASVRRLSYPAHEDELSYMTYDDTKQGRAFIQASFFPIDCDAHGNPVVDKSHGALTVIGVHFGIPERQKMHELTYLLRFADNEQYAHKDNAVICLGDMNTFFDKDGPAMVEYARERGYVDHSQGARYSQSGKRALYSFNPCQADGIYHPDRHTCPPGLLDRCFSTKNVKNVSTVVETRTHMPDGEPKEMSPKYAHLMPSDHCPVIYNVCWERSETQKRG